jgi:antitoxin component of MazEF toxin-antitoxin module
VKVENRPQFIKKSLQAIGKHSLAVVIPAPWLDEMGCNSDSIVSLEFDGRRVIIQKAVETNEGTASSS